MIRPLASAWIEWVDADQKAQFASLKRPGDTWIIVLDGQEIGWVEFRRIGDERFQKQLNIKPKYQRQGIGLKIILLLNEQSRTAKSMALFVLMNNPAFRFYVRHGLEVMRENPHHVGNAPCDGCGGLILPIECRLGADAIQSITSRVAASQMTEFVGHRIFHAGSGTKMKCRFTRSASHNYFQIILFIRSAN